MRLFLNYICVALVGGFGYCLIEIIWRGRTHYSMFFAGAIVLSCFFYISKNYSIPFWLKCVIGSLLITLIEFIFGLVFNLAMKENVWDYSNVPFNILGQICIPFSFLWLLLSGVAFKILDKVPIL